LFGSLLYHSSLHLPVEANQLKRNNIITLRSLWQSRASEPALVREGTDGCVEMKPEDRYAVPAMHGLPWKQHRVGVLSLRFALRIASLIGAWRRYIPSTDLSALCSGDNRSRRNHIWLSRTVFAVQISHHYELSGIAPSGGNLEPSVETHLDWSSTAKVMATSPGGSRLGQPCATKRSRVPRGDPGIQAYQTIIPTSPLSCDNCRIH